MLVTLTWLGVGVGVGVMMQNLVLCTQTTGEDGAYAFADPDSGEYTVIATGYPPTATALTVNGRGVDDYDIELGHPGE